jgi:serine protease
MASARPFPSSGVPDDDTGPVVACRAPNGTEQLQCYCTTSTCGAGMLDAGGAVAAAVGMRATFSVTPAAPQAGRTITLDSSASTVPAGRVIASRSWTLVDGGGVASGFAGPTDGVTATLNPSAAGTLVVRFRLTDDRGISVSTQQSIAVAAAPGGGSGGGGTPSFAWAALLALAVACLAKRSPA